MCITFTLPLCHISGDDSISSVPVTAASLPGALCFVESLHGTWALLSSVNSLHGTGSVPQCKAK